MHRWSWAHTCKLLYTFTVTNPLQHTGKPIGKGKQAEIHLKVNYGTWAYGQDGITETGYSFPLETTKKLIKYMKQLFVKQWTSGNKGQWCWQRGNQWGEPKASQLTALSEFPSPGVGKGNPEYFQHWWDRPESPERIR